MADPVAADLLGVKYATLVAGFAGGVVSLAYLKEMTKPQMILAVLTGSAVAGYLTPIAIPVLARAAGIDAAPSLENAAAFLLGLTAMNIIPAIVRLSEIVRSNPKALIGKGK